MDNKFRILKIVTVALGILILILVSQAAKILPNPKTGENQKQSGFENIIKTPLPTPTPTPRPLTFAEMNQLYGPCAVVPVLMYHHVQGQPQAKENGQAYLSVDPDFFREQLAYLKTKGYQIISAAGLVNFFNTGQPLPAKPVLLTFDDGYEDFYTNAFVILRETNAQATVFLTTGLMQNPGYLTWEQIKEMANSGLVTFGNHTWSHHTAATTKDIIEKEISTAGIQLSERGLNNEKIFAYPYGSRSLLAENYLKSINYNLAFTTIPGRILCKQQIFSLPRLRVGNSPLSSYGL